MFYYKIYAQLDLPKKGGKKDQGVGDPNIESKVPMKTMSYYQKFLSAIIFQKFKNQNKWKN